MEPYTKLTDPRRMLLTASMLLGVAAAPVPGVDSQVARVVVPEGSMLVLVHDEPMSLYLQAREEAGRVAGAAGSNVTVTVNVNHDGKKLLQTTRSGPAFPTADHPDVIAFTQVTGQAWAPARVLAVDWNAGTVDVETPNNAGKIRVYHTFGDGEIALTAGRPFGSSSGTVQLFRSSARALHEISQSDRDAAVYATKAPQPIPQNFTFGIAVRANSAVYFDGLARHEVGIPMSETAIQVHDAVALAELAERQLKGS